MKRHMHLRDPGIRKVSLCFDQRLQDWQLTDDPKQVTCKRCRRMMERRAKYEAESLRKEGLGPVRRPPDGMVHCPDCGAYLGDYKNGVLYKFGREVVEPHKCEKG